MVGYAEELSYRPQYAPIISRANPRGQRDAIADMISEETRASEARGERNASRLQGMIEAPVESFMKGADRAERQADAAQARGLRDKQALLSEEQLKQAQLNRQLEEQYGARTRESNLSSAESQSQVQRLLAEQTKREQDMLAKIDPETGRSFAELQITSPIEQARSAQKLQERQVKIAEDAAGQNAQLAKMQLANLKNADVTKELIGRYQFANTPEEKNAIIQNAIKAGNPVAAYDAISQIKSAETQADMYLQLKANSDTGYRENLETAKAARTEQRAANIALAEIDSKIEELKKGNFGSGDAAQAAETIAELADKYGLSRDAADMRKMFTVDLLNFGSDKNVFQSRTDKAQEIRRKLAATVANRIQQGYGDVEGVSNWAQRTREEAWTGAQKLNAGNLITTPQGGAANFPAPVGVPTPQTYYNPGQPQMQQPQPQGAGIQNMQSLPPSIVEALRKGQPVTQSAGAK